jgi:hypothetical protein
VRNRHRRMFELTGLPGWVRFGYSPGWQGRSPSGLGPCAQYLMHGEWPTPEMNLAWQEGQVPFAPAPGFPMPGFATPYDPWGAAELTAEQEVRFLEAEEKRIRDEMTAIEERIRELQREPK